MPLAERLPFLVVLALDISPNRRAVTTQVRKLVKIIHHIGDGHDPADIADGIEEIKPFRFGIFRRLAGKFLHGLVRPEQHRYFTEPGGLFQKAQVNRKEIIEDAGDDDGFESGTHLLLCSRGRESAQSIICFPEFCADSRRRLRVSEAMRTVT